MVLRASCALFLTFLSRVSLSLSRVSYYVSLRYRRLAANTPRHVCPNCNIGQALLVDLRKHVDQCPPANNVWTDAGVLAKSLVFAGQNEGMRVRLHSLGGVDIYHECDCDMCRDYDPSAPVKKRVAKAKTVKKEKSYRKVKKEKKPTKKELKEQAAKEKEEKEEKEEREEREAKEVEAKETEETGKEDNDDNGDEKGEEDEEVGADEDEGKDAKTAEEEGGRKDGDTEATGKDDDSADDPADGNDDKTVGTTPVKTTPVRTPVQTTPHTTHGPSSSKEDIEKRIMAKRGMAGKVPVVTGHGIEHKTTAHHLTNDIHHLPKEG